MEWIINNLEAIIGIVTAIITIASIIVKLTPSETDNVLLEKIVKVFEFIGLNSKPIEKK